MNIDTYPMTEKERPEDRLKGHVKALLDITSKSGLVKEQTSPAVLEEFAAIAYVNALPFHPFPPSFKRLYVFWKNGKTLSINSCPEDKNVPTQEDVFKTWAEGFYDLLFTLHGDMKSRKDPLAAHIFDMMKKTRF